MSANTNKRTKDDVFHIRSSQQDKKLIEKAASSVGLAASSYMLQSSLKAAKADLAEIQNISLSKKDASIFLNALNETQSLNASLKSAFEDYKKQSKK